MAEDAAEPGSRKDPQKLRAGRLRKMPAGSPYFGKNIDATVREAQNARISLRQIVTSRATVRIDRVSFFSRNQEFSGRQAHGANFADAIEIDTFPIFPNDLITSKKIECRSLSEPPRENQTP
jgi:hypothetical protein